MSEHQTVSAVVGHITLAATGYYCAAGFASACKQGVKQKEPGTASWRGGFCEILDAGLGQRAASCPGQPCAGALWTLTGSSPTPCPA